MLPNLPTYTPTTSVLAQPRRCRTRARAQQAAAYGTLAGVIGIGAGRQSKAGHKGQAYCKLLHERFLCYLSVSVAARCRKRTARGTHAAADQRAGPSAAARCSPNGCPGAGAQQTARHSARPRRLATR